MYHAFIKVPLPLPQFKCRRMFFSSFWYIHAISEIHVVIILSTLGPLRLHLSVIRNILLLFNDWFGCCSFSCHIWFFVLWCCAWLLFISMSCLSIFFNAVFGLCSFWSCFGNSSFYCRVRLLFLFMPYLDIVLFVVPL